MSATLAVTKSGKAKATRRMFTKGNEGFSLVVEEVLNMYLDLLLWVDMEDTRNGAIKINVFKRDMSKFIKSLGKNTPLRHDYSRTVDFTECIPYSGFISDDGYASTSVRQTAFEFFAGRKCIPGTHLDHACCQPKDCGLGIDCPHRRCVNASHFIEVPAEINIGRNAGTNGFGISANSGSVRGATDLCYHGHEMTPENTMNCGRCLKCNANNQANFKTNARATRHRRKLALDPAVLLNEVDLGMYREPVRAKVVVKPKPKLKPVTVTMFTDDDNDNEDLFEGLFKS